MLSPRAQLLRPRVSMLSIPGELLRTTPAAIATSLRGTAVRWMSYNPATQGWRRDSRGATQEASGILKDRNANSSQRQGVPRARQPNCALGKNRMSDSRRFQTSVYAALPLMVRPACKSAARFANMPAQVPKEPEHDPSSDFAQSVRFGPTECSRKRFFRQSHSRVSRRSASSGRKQVTARQDAPSLE